MNVISYIDESGDTGYTTKSTRFFIVTALCTQDHVDIHRIVRNIHTTKRNKATANQLHTNKESVSTKNKILRKIKNIPMKCICVKLDKSKIVVLDPYIYLLESIAIILKNEKIYSVVLARKDTRTRYNKNIVNLFLKYGIKVRLSHPTTEKVLQVTDFYSWSIFSHLEYGKSDYFNALQNTITLI